MHGDAKYVIVALTLAHRGRPADDLRPGVLHRTVRAPDKSHLIIRTVSCTVIPKHWYGIIGRIWQNFVSAGRT